eukprot:3093854-Prymnesium_polylepis.1
MDCAAERRLLAERSHRAANSQFHEAPVDPERRSTVLSGRAWIRAPRASACACCSKCTHMCG